MYAAAINRFSLMTDMLYPGLGIVAGAPATLALGFAMVPPGLRNC